MDAQRVLAYKQLLLEMMTQQRMTFQDLYHLMIAAQQLCDQSHAPPSAVLDYIVGRIPSATVQVTNIFPTETPNEKQPVTHTESASTELPSTAMNCITESPSILPVDSKPMVSVDLSAISTPEAMTPRLVAESSHCPSPALHVSPEPATESQSELIESTESTSVATVPSADKVEENEANTTTETMTKKRTYRKKQQSTLQKQPFQQQPTNTDSLTLLSSFKSTQATLSEDDEFRMEPKRRKNSMKLQFEPMNEMSLCKLLYSPDSALIAMNPNDSSLFSRNVYLNVLTMEDRLKLLPLMTEADRECPMKVYMKRPFDEDELTCQVRQRLAKGQDSTVVETTNASLLFNDPIFKDHLRQFLIALADGSYQSQIPDEFKEAIASQRPRRQAKSTPARKKPLPTVPIVSDEWKDEKFERFWGEKRAQFEKKEAKKATKKQKLSNNEQQPPLPPQKTHSRTLKSRQKKREANGPLWHSDLHFV